MTPKPWTRSRIEPAMPVAITRPSVGKHADLAADHDEAGDLDERQRQEKSGMKGKRIGRGSWSCRASSRPSAGTSAIR